MKLFQADFYQKIDATTIRISKYYYELIFLILSVIRILNFFHQIKKRKMYCLKYTY